MAESCRRDLRAEDALLLRLVVRVDVTPLLRVVRRVDIANERDTDSEVGNESVERGESTGIATDVSDTFRKRSDL
jgi:hypothetical protein